MTNLVSVIIPSKDRADLIERSLLSVVKQSYKKVEIIVIDDGSTDGTQEIIKTNFPQVKIIRNEHSLGGAIARNQGADVAKGRFLAFLDSDDEWLPDHLSKMIGFLKKNNYKGVFSSFYISYDEGKSQLSPPFQYKQKSDNILKYIISSGSGGDIRTSTMVFKKEAFDSVRFDEKFKKYQDWDLAISFDNKYGLGCLNQRTALLHVNAKDRMSAKMNLDATHLFYQKHSGYFTESVKIDFFLKLAYKAAVTYGRSCPEFKYALENLNQCVRDKFKVNLWLKMRLMNFPFFNLALLYFKTKRLLNK